jgi:hypothetical protein
MQMAPRKIVLGGAVVAAAAAVSAGIAIAASGDARMDGATLKQASVAALAATGGGTVLEVERGDEGTAYEVEVRTPAGALVDVQLDEGFHVVGTPGQDDESGDADDGGAQDDD